MKMSVLCYVMKEFISKSKFFNNYFMSVHVVTLYDYFFKKNSKFSREISSD